MHNIKEPQTASAIVTKNGNPVVVMVGISDENDVARVMLFVPPKVQAWLNKAEKRIQETGAISHDDIW